MKEKLRLALVLPPFVSTEFRDTGMKQSLPNIGVAYLAANVDTERVEPRIFDCLPLEMQLPELLSKLEQFHPHIVGLNAPTFKIIDAHKTAKAIKERLPDTLILIGGDHATAVPEDTLKEFPAFDFLVYGEGEITLNKILDKILSQGHEADLGGIKGTCRRDNGAIILEPPRPLIQNLDSLKFPAFHLMPVDKYIGVFTYFTLKRRALTLSTGRGCIYKCVFCNRTIGDTHRPRSNDSVMEEVAREIRDFQVLEYYITDESLLSKRDHIEEFCEKYIKNGFHKTTSWICFSRVDETSPELLKLMKRAGCRIVSYGIESGNEEILKIIKKRITLQQAVDSVKWTKEAGLLANTNFMIGLPGDTRDTIRDTINFAFRTDAQIAAFQLMVPFPGTEAMLMAQRGQGGIKILTNDYSKYCKGVGNAHEMDTVPRAELERLQRNAWLRYYLRPSKIKYIFLFIDIRMMFVGTWHLLVSRCRNIFHRPVGTDKQAAPGNQNDSSF